MGNNILYNVYSDYLKKKYGTKVYKLPVGLPVTCPNRDGQCGAGGCTFCGEIGAGYENLPAEMTVAEQIKVNMAHIAPKYKAEKFIAYFQNFSNTYLEIDKLKSYLEEACQKDVVAIALATRPDCVNEEYLKMLQKFKKEKNIDIIIELGLQTVNYHSLRKVNRGHSLAEFIDAVLRIKQYQLEVCVHLILNFPWDDLNDVIENAKILSSLKVDQVKLHALYIVKNTKMAEQYINGELTLIDKDEYKERVITFLEYLAKDIVVQRLIGRAPESNTLFSNWKTGWWKIRDDITKTMQERGCYQGRLCDYLNGKAVQRFL